MIDPRRGRTHGHVHQVIGGDDVVNSSAGGLGPLLERPLRESVSAASAGDIESGEIALAKGGLLSGNLGVAGLDGVALGGEKDSVGGRVR